FVGLSPPMAPSPLALLDEPRHRRIRPLRAFPPVGILTRTARSVIQRALQAFRRPIVARRALQQAVPLPVLREAVDRADLPRSRIAQPLDVIVAAAGRAAAVADHDGSADVTRLRVVTLGYSWMVTTITQRLAARVASE